MDAEHARGVPNSKPIITQPMLHHGEAANRGQQYHTIIKISRVQQSDVPRVHSTERNGHRRNSVPAETVGSGQSNSICAVYVGNVAVIRRCIACMHA